VKRPDNHGLLYQALVFVGLLVVGLYLQSKATDVAKTLTPDAIRIGLTYLVFAFALIVLLDLALSHWERRASESRTDGRLAVIESSVSKLVEDVRDLIEMTTKTGPIKGFLVSTKTLLKEEGAIAQGEVWVYTPELSADTTEEFAAVIASNIQKGIKYRYFLPDVPDRHSDFDILVTRVCGANGQTENQAQGSLEVSWLPPALSRPGGITIHIHEGAPRVVAGFTTIPYEKWANDFFIRMDNTYSARAWHYLRELDSQYRVK